MIIDNIYVTVLQWIQTVTGKVIAVVNGYTYYKNKESKSGAFAYYRCSMKLKCNARFTYDKQGGIRNANLLHRHEPKPCEYKYSDAALTTDTSDSFLRPM